jgi:hypothetical protein
LQFVIFTNIFFSIGCQKELKLENLPNSNFTTNSITLNQSEIQEFIDSVNAVHIRQNSSDQIGLNSALSLMESALNYSFSDVDTALINEDTATFYFDFNLSVNSSGNCEFLNVANVTKEIATYVKSNCCSNELLRYSIGKIENINEGEFFRLVITVGEMDADFNYLAAPSPPEVNGNFLWRIDQYNFYNYTNCQYNQPYAPTVLEEKINTYLLNFANYRTREVALAAPPGFQVYYDDKQNVYNSSTGKNYFQYFDFNNLSKLDWPIDMLAYTDFVACASKADEPFQAPIFAADPSKVACLILFDPAIYGYKSCITQPTMNYYIKKSIEIYDVIKPTRLEDLFSKMYIIWKEPEFEGDPIEHVYKFYTKKAKTRPINANLL